ncbi:alpha/beta hydrolase [Actinomadura sp. DC4]|uniref:alpha/beta fold hydrolase n=1 Tax=Actinomadura sp. DC4 TaxID=3055069 RepID=UPI0025B27497|nr:alpha/beta hydrolase [Actinomadura sp. DC4]MDN3356372.1 alpha/beta hydrolase [Actinomadura sp. DC4]
MPFTIARETRFHTVELAADRTGEPVVMLHGLFTGSVASWYLTAAPAVAARHRVRLFDWRGHGLSERTRTGYGAQAMAADLDALTADLPPFTIVAHSYGCVVALRFLQSAPDRVRRMALVEPPLNQITVSAERLLELYTGPASRRVRALVEDTTLLEDLAAEPPVTDEDLRSLSAVPCLVIGGGRSPFAPSVERLRRVCPHVRAHLLPGGHDVHVGATGGVTDLLTGFLELSEAAHG